MRFGRLHMETDCGRRRSSVDVGFGGTEPMETHGQLKSVFVKSEIEEKSIENDIANAIESVVEDDSCIEMNIEDPLLWVPAEEKYLNAGTSENQTAMGNAIEDSLECISDEK